jgi:hypothetical protein
LTVEYEGWAPELHATGLTNAMQFVVNHIFHSRPLIDEGEAYRFRKFFQHDAP